MLVGGALVLGARRRGCARGHRAICMSPAGRTLECGSRLPLDVAQPPGRLSYAEAPAVKAPARGLPLLSLPPEGDHSVP